MAVVLTLKHAEHQNPLKGLLKHSLRGSTSRISDSVGMGWGLRIFISNMFPEDAHAADAGPFLENH